MKVRSKRQVEIEAHVEEERLRQQQEQERILAALHATEPTDGYVSIGSLPVSSVSPHTYCLRCGANVIGRERHDAWHQQLGH